MKKLLLALLITPAFFTFSQQTFVPDDNFEAFLEGSGLGNGIANDDSVTTANVSGLTDLIVSAQGIADITGIEDFTALTLIIFDGNPIVSADLSGNPSLNYIGMTGCSLTSIDVTQNTLLETLLCATNSLTSIDVSNCPLLEVLNCNVNSLTSLDVSQNTALTELSLNINPVGSLDVTQNTALTELNCVQNGLTLLDVTQNTSLITLDCRSNALTALDVSQNVALEVFFCRANSLTSLDVSASPNLYNFNCSVNALQCLNADNSNDFANPLAPGTYLFVSFGNLSLSCAEVSFPVTANASYIADAGTVFNADCLPPMPDSSVTQNGTLLTADLASAAYQWVDCDDNNNPIPGETSQSFTPTVTGNYAVEITVANACGSTNTNLSDCFLVDYTGLEELLNGEKELVKIIDITGRETEFKPNTPLIFMYSDGSTERVMEIRN